MHVNEVMYLFSSVNLHVSVDVAFLCEAASTNLAGVGLLARVDHHMRFQVTCEVEQQEIENNEILPFSIQMLSMPLLYLLLGEKQQRAYLFA